MTCRSFNIRVYGILKNEKGEVLLSHEKREGFQFTKFPGGGLEQGEGIKDCLIRELDEEINLQVNSNQLEHLYTTDFYQASAFNPNDQIISIYYLVMLHNYKRIKTIQTVGDLKNDQQVFTWNSLESLQEDHLNFPIDKVVLSLI